MRLGLTLPHGIVSSALRGLLSAESSEKVLLAVSASDRRHAIAIYRAISRYMSLYSLYIIIYNIMIYHKLYMIYHVIYACKGYK